MVLLTASATIPFSVLGFAFGSVTAAVLNRAGLFTVGYICQDSVADHKNRIHTSCFAKETGTPTPQALCPAKIKCG